MANYDLILRNAKIVLPYEIFHGDIGIKGEKIAAIGTIIGTTLKEYDIQGRYVFPGVIDAHTHFQLPLGSIISRDTFYSGSIAAAFGGVTTFIDFVNVDPQRTLLELLKERINEARDAVIDYTFHSTVTGWRDERRAEIKEVIDEGVTSFKFFMAYGESGRRTDDGMLYSAFSEIAKYNALATIHAENDELVALFSERLKREGKVVPRYYPLSRPNICEEIAIKTVLNIADATGTGVYIVHISTKEGAEALKEARRAGKRAYGETTPHYLVLDDTYASRYVSVCPPIRKKEDSDVLWSLLLSEDISVVATDHCPFTKKDKEIGDTIWDIPYGLPGVETLFPLMFTFSKEHDISYSLLSRILSLNPATIFELYPHKGALYPGFDADLIVVDPEKQKKISHKDLHMSSDYSPYEGFVLSGFPDMVFSRGELIIEEGQFLGEKGRGKYIKRRVSL